MQKLIYLFFSFTERRPSSWQLRSFSVQRDVRQRRQTSKDVMYDFVIQIKDAAIFDVTHGKNMGEYCGYVQLFYFL